MRGLRFRSRFLGWLATVGLVAMTLMSPWSAIAQDATPATGGEPITSLTREEFTAQLQEELQFTEAATPGGTFIAANTGDLQTINPFLAEDEESIAVVELLFDSLYGSDVRNGQPAPTGLADYWEISADGLTYTFHLNKSATWHDGVDFTAADVQFSFDTTANLEVGSAYTQSFLNAVKSWRVIDADTFEVVAKEPRFTFLYEMVAFIVPKHIWESVPVADWRTDGGSTGQDPSRVVGSGAWKFGEWRQGESITLNRNDAYYGKVPYLDSYVIRIWPDQTAIVNALLNGEIDAAMLEPADVATVEATAGLKVVTYPTRGFTFYMTNLDPEKTTLFLDKGVRQALMHGLDRESIANDIELGYAEVAQGTQPVLSYAYAPDRITTTYDYDPEKASALLAEVGWTDSDGDGIVDKDGQRLAFEMIYPSGSPTSDQVVAYMQDAWRAIGIEATPSALDFATFVDILTTDHTFEMALLGFGWDASFLQASMFGCDQYEGGFNMVRYCNEEVDAIDTEAKRTFDEDARRELMIEAANLVNEDLPVGVMYFSKTTIGHSDRLQNFAPSDWGIYLGYVWIQQ